MTLIDLGDFKLRFDPKEVRINIDGDMIDVGARRMIEENIEENIVEKMMLNDGCVTREYSQSELQTIFNNIYETQKFAKETQEELLRRRK